jgi:hypothetical protein
MISILEILEEWIYSKLELAMHKNKVLLKAEQLSNDLIKHLILIYLFPEYRDYIHWKNEIIDKLTDFRYIEVKNKIKVKPKHYYDKLFSEEMDPFDADSKNTPLRGFLYRIFRDYKIHTNIDINNKNELTKLYDKLKMFFTSISILISDRTISPDKIDILIKKFEEK